jgi:hypothetical protein
MRDKLIPLRFNDLFDTVLGPTARRPNDCERREDKDKKRKRQVQGVLGLKAKD